MNSAVEKTLLLPLLSGNYLSTYDIVQIGKNLGIKLDFKKRSLILQKLFIETKEQKLKLIEEFTKLLNKKEAKYKKLALNYPNSAHIINEWIKKINKTKVLIQRGAIYG